MTPLTLTAGDGSLLLIALALAARQMHDHTGHGTDSALCRDCVRRAFRASQFDRLAVRIDNHLSQERAGELTAPPRAATPQKQPRTAAARRQLQG